MNYQKGFKVSLVINCIVFSLFVSWGGYFYRDVLTNKIKRLFLDTEIPSEEQLKQFNNEPLETINDSLMVGSSRTISILFLGNSITCTGAPEEEEDKERRGLTSTKKDKDYVHRLVQMICDNNKINVRFTIINIADFERNFTRYGFDKDKLSNGLNVSPDYLIVQIGENVSKADIKSNPRKYEYELQNLLGCFPNSKKIITLPFWPYKEVNYSTTKVAITTKSLIADLSHLGNGTDENCFASSYRRYKQKGVGNHPGDYGMEKIAESIYTEINVLLSLGDNL